MTASYEPRVRHTAEWAHEDTVVDHDGAIEVRHVRWRSPLPKDAAPHPESLDHLSYLRYRLTDEPNSAPADAILLIQPGNYLGHYSLDGLARATVHSAAAKGMAIEVWTLARRSAGLDDPTGVVAAQAVGDPEIAFEYYFNNQQVDGRTFDGINSDDDLACLADLGFAQVVHDMHETIQRFIPDRDFCRQKVFIGGHSGGAIVAATFGAWDFDGVPGHELCRGFVALDTPLDCDFGTRTNPLLRVATWPLRTLAQALYPLVVAGLKSGKIPRSSGSFVALTAYVLRLLGLYAHLKPDAESDLMPRLDKALAATPQHRAWQFLNRFVFAANLGQALTGRRSPRNFRYTNQAAFGMWLSTGVSPLGVTGISIGTFDGPCQIRTFPLPAQAWQTPLIKGLVTYTLGQNPLASPIDPDHLYRWTSAIGPTQPAEICSSAKIFAGGVGAGFEPYHASRYTIDQAFIMLGARPSEFNNVKHEKQMRQKPLVSLFTGLVPFAPRLPFVNVGQAHVIPNYSHVDASFAVPRQDGSVEPISDHITTFLLKHTPPSERDSLAPAETEPAECADAS